MSTPWFEIMLGLLQNMRSIQDCKVLMICLRLSIISLYPAVDMRLSISDPTPFAILLLLQLELLALKSLMTIKHIGSSSFILPKG